MDNCVEVQILGYDFNGKPVAKKGDLFTCCCVQCRNCGKILSADGGPKKIYCEDCAKQEGIIKE
ncbi:hypothetical protein [Alkaliphilus serpentinus]|uniref:Uncharacterized protein n=1 Tax=Alkaliphilus serpentinus TaxID=1482731 RepID=A0A833HN64_9FIRM|nr:hypothetical protein [Alkaliphilus serpentinus]KAB3529248.1 hypothetical protein F8153_09580 [Alkaliphilus serpentinus]